MKEVELALPDARRIWLRAQRLDTRAPFGSGPEATKLAVEHLGYVQIDTINVIERSHHHILFSRIPAYRRADLRHAVMSGAVERLRPKVMTVAAIMAGLLPLMWSDGTGSEVMRRIAVPMCERLVHRVEEMRPCCGRQPRRRPHHDVAGRGDRDRAQRSLPARRRSPRRGAINPRSGLGSGLRRPSIEGREDRRQRQHNGAGPDQEAERAHYRHRLSSPVRNPPRWCLVGFLLVKTVLIAR